MVLLRFGQPNPRPRSLGTFFLIHCKISSIQYFIQFPASLLESVKMVLSSVIVNCQSHVKVKLEKNKLDSCFLSLWPAKFRLAPCTLQSCHMLPCICIHCMYIYIYYIYINNSQCPPHKLQLAGTSGLSRSIFYYFKKYYFSIHTGKRHSFRRSSEFN